MISVLYIDDQEDLLNIGKIFLEKSGEISADICSDPKKAFDHLTTRNYDAIISDYEMPEIDGITLLKNIRQRGCNTPFIIFTGKGREEVAIDALNSGADFYLQKGGDPKAQFIELIHKLKKAVDKQKTERALEKQISLIKRITEISTGLMNTPFLFIDKKIEDALEEIGNLCRSDRCYLMMWDDETKKTFSITHDWCKPGYKSAYEEIQNENLSDYYKIFFELDQNQYVLCDSVTRKKTEEPEFFGKIGDLNIQSILLVPIQIGEVTTGILGLDTLLQETSWIDEEINTLRIFGQVIINAIIRRKGDQKLVESEERYRNVVEQQAEFICRYRPDGTHIFVNNAYCMYFGIPSDEVIGKKFKPKMPKEDLKELCQYFSKLTPENPDGTIEHQVIFPDGGIRWQQWSDHAVFDEHGTCVEYQSVGRDITDRKRIEINLAQSEELYRTVFESTGTAMMVLDEDTSIISANHEMERISGYSRSNIEHSMSWTSFVSPEDLKRMYEYHQNRRKGVSNIPSQYEFTFITRDNQRIRSFITVGMIPDTKQSIVSIIDISKLSDTEHALRESEEKFRKLAESLSLGVYIIQDEKFLYANPYIVSLLGYTLEELCSLPFFSFFLEEDIPTIKKTMEDRLTKKTSSVVYHVHAKTKRKTIILIEIQGSITFYQSKPAFIGIFKKLEEEHE